MCRLASCAFWLTLLDVRGACSTGMLVGMVAGMVADILDDMLAGKLAVTVPSLRKVLPLWAPSSLQESPSVQALSPLQMVRSLEPEQLGMTSRSDRRIS